MDECPHGDVEGICPACPAQKPAPAPERPPGAIPAAYRTVCALGDDITPGEWIIPTSRGWAHADCAEGI